MEVMTSLYKISDALGIPLLWDKGELSGRSENGVFSPLPGLDFPILITAKKIFANDTVGVLAHVAGDLYVLVSHFYKTNSVSAFLIDGGKLSMDGVQAPPELFISKGMSLREVIAAVRVGVVSSFVWKNRQWEPLKLPN